MLEKQTGYNTPAAENLKRLLKERGITGYEFAVTVGYTPAAYGYDAPPQDHATAGYHSADRCAWR